MSGKTKSISPELNKPVQPHDEEKVSNDSKIPPSIPTPTSNSFIPLTDKQLMLLTSKCTITETKEDGKILHIPVKDFPWIICIPHTSIIEVSREAAGASRKVIPRVLDMCGDDWSKYVEVFHNGMMLEPVSRLCVEIDRGKELFPKIKWELM